jgi:mannose/fructose/N-acetylgalactosamine-specific phosphotransferase system component IIC
MPYTPHGNLLNHPRATKSLTYGVLSIFCFGFIFGVIAIYFGVTAIQSIDANPHTYQGKGLAIAGIILGAIGALTWVGIIFN